MQLEEKDLEDATRKVPVKSAMKKAGAFFFLLMVLELPIDRKSVV